MDFCTSAELQAKATLWTPQHAYAGEATMVPRVMDLATLVNTHELAFTRGTMIHTLAARALMRDW